MKTRPRLWILLSSLFLLYGISSHVQNCYKGNCFSVYVAINREGESFCKHPMAVKEFEMNAGIKQSKGQIGV